MKEYPKFNPEDIKVIIATDCGSTTTKCILIEKLDEGFRQRRVRQGLPGGQTG